jgi:flagellar motor switch protein FliM
VIERKGGDGSFSMQGKKSVIHQKAKVAREEFDARGMSTSKALRLALARVADQYYDLPVVVTTVEQFRLAQSGLPGEISEDGLLLLLDGPARYRGALCLDTQFLTAMIEVQTTGNVRNGRAEARAITPTDAAICAPFIDKLFEAVQAQLADIGRADATGSFRFADRVEDTRTLTLSLDAVEYEVFRLSVDLADGAKSGVLTVVLPIVQEPGRQELGIGSKPTDKGAAHLSDVVRNAPVTLNAVLYRLEMPLKEACKLQVGMCFPISPAALQDAKLTATGGHVVAHVVLGQVNGFRAARMVSARNGPLPQDAKESDQGRDGPQKAAQDHQQTSLVLEPSAALQSDRKALTAGPNTMDGKPEPFTDIETELADSH